MTGQFGAVGANLSGSDTTRPSRRLDSWKEIAAFFGRDERTVKRWEKERALPVHRLPGGSRARVYALTDELERWMQAPEAQAPEVVEADPPAEAVAPEAPVAVITEDNPKRDRWFWVLAGLLFLIAAGIVGWRHHAGRSTTIEAPVKASTHQVNPEAEDLYLKGRFYWNRRTPADLTKAVDFFTQAIVRDPNYAQPYVGLADCYNLLREYAAMPNDEAFPRALAAAKKAVELDDNSAEAHAALGFVTYYWSWDTPGAEAEFRRALELNPQYAAAHHWYATVLMSSGRFDDSMKEFEAAQKLDPASAPILADKALLLFNEGRVDEAEALLKQVEASQPNFFSAHRYLASVYGARGDYPDSLSEARQAAQLSHDEQELSIVRAAEHGYRTGGEGGMLENTLEVQKKLCGQGRLSPFLVAQTAALLGDKDEAMRYLRLSYQHHDVYLLTAGMDHSLASLHHDADFEQLLSEAGLARN